jgi:hypothetical protein
MAGATRIITPEKVRKLQIVLYRKAKAQPKYRLHCRPQRRGNWPDE